MAILVVAMCGSCAAADLAVVATMDSSGPTQANVINPYDLLDLTPEQLAERFPNLPASELDKLVFKIADINSMRTLPR
ncbi:hypothetical protein [Devosia sp.]|uniref:hypothetical protein n=1 Tax=Devosia sp. TaxID=1871048 RepID=UPI0027365531|nr:hypothetical protein [Devosia sp.]MDP2779162.1 hypothetical protein [Devosia sp.]